MAGRKKIFFAADLTAPIMQSDAEMLQEEYNVYLFDQHPYITSPWRWPEYLINCMSNLHYISDADVSWTWFADYLAVPIVALTKISGKKSVVVIGGFEVNGMRDIGYGAQLSFIRGIVVRWVLRNSDVCIVGSEAYKKQTLEVEPKANIFVNPQWVQKELCDAPLPEKSGVCTGIFTVNKVNALVKGLDIFQKATYGLDAEVLTGLSQYDLIEKMKKKKVYCQFSRTENFGHNLLQAMACGCVPVVSDQGNLPALVGSTGFVVPVNNVNAAREAIIKALRDNGTAARQRAKEYLRERAKKGIMEVVERLCKTS